MFGMIFWISGMVLVIGGAVTMGTGRTLEGGLLIVAGVLLGPVAMMLFI